VGLKYPVRRSANGNFSNIESQDFGVNAETSSTSIQGEARALPFRELEPPQIIAGLVRLTILMRPFSARIAEANSSIFPSVSPVRLLTERGENLAHETSAVISSAPKVGLWLTFSNSEDILTGF
jgi:hypothetical protein